jgi:imidazolonepropionase-like amidohydrolase
MPSLLRCALLALAAALAAGPALAQTPPAPITIRAARVLDGKGGALSGATIEIRGDRITAVDRRPGPVTLDLGDATLMPGLIDVHVHIGYHFGKDGRARNDGDRARPVRRARAESGRDGAVRRRERLAHAEERVHHGAEPRGGG